MLTSDNYDDSEKKADDGMMSLYDVVMLCSHVQPKVTGGRNGYGAKLTNIFSKKPETK